MYKVELSTEIHSRRDFALLCNARRLWRAVEVGVDQGCFARDFLDRWTQGLLFLIDPYQPYPEMNWDRDADRALALAKLAPHAGRVRFIRQPSPAAIAAIPANFMVEFVYIDGAHDYASVSRDLAAWWDRLYDGETILAGHDYDAEHSQVMAAVNDFAVQRGLRVRLTREGDTTPSWYIYKQEPAHLCALHAP